MRGTFVLEVFFLLFSFFFQGSLFLLFRKKGQDAYSKKKSTVDVPKGKIQFFFFGPGLDLKLHPGVRSSRNSMKVLTARTDVSYLRDYKTGGEEGYAGRFCAFRVFLFFSNPASPISPVHSLCLSVGVCGTSPSPQGLNAPALFYASSPWQGI